jgi:DNA polymerase IV (DinB-like DNA polymerase)
MSLLQNWGTAFQQGGIDEAYIELTERFSSFSVAEASAREIQERILNEIGISASIGIAPNKSLAKIASDYRKPHGLVMVLPDQIQSFLSPLEITKIHGIGKKTKGFWFQAGINTIGDLYRWNKEKIIKYFSVQGEWAWNVAHGLDNRPVLESYERKSIGAERTFLEDTADLNRVIKILLTLNSRLHEEMTSKKIHYRTIGIKIRFQGYETFTRAISLSSPIRNEQVAAMKVFELMNEFARYSKKIRLVGLRFSGLSDEKIPHYQTVLNFTSTRKKAIPNDEIIYSSRSVDNGK